MGNIFSWHFKTTIMKHLLVLLFFTMSLISCASCSKSTSAVDNDNNTNPTGSKMRLKIGNSTFTATLYDNAMVTAFKSRLPMTVNMIELNGNEKYFDLPQSLPTNASNPGTIQNGDLMLYGANTLVLFYKTFSTSYSYTRLGRIDDVTGLVAALGSGNVSVTFELQLNQYYTWWTNTIRVIVPLFIKTSLSLIWLSLCLSLLRSLLSRFASASRNEKGRNIDLEKIELFTGLFYPVIPNKEHKSGKSWSKRFEFSTLGATKPFQGKCSRVALFCFFTFISK